MHYITGNMLGFLGAILLLAPPIRLEVVKLRIRLVERTPITAASIKPMRVRLADHMKEARDRHNGWDSLALIAGACLLAVGFLLNLSAP